MVYRFKYRPEEALFMRTATSRALRVLAALALCLADGISAWLAPAVMPHLRFTRARPAAARPACAPRMTGRFGDTPSTGGAGTMYSFAYPGSLLQPNTSTAPTTVSLVAHAGGWRDGAAFYRDWLRSVGTEQHKASWCEAASLLLCA